ncbi:tetraspanin-18-like [Antedon mediterranea]|uniref:tetraspanin-18-like n=1 Tax=Antedon mediterranea TaxID=105859 RepID=UPI003AF71245
MDSLGLRCMKYLLFAFNFILIIGGIGLIGLGIMHHTEILTEIKTFEPILDNKLFEYSPNILLGVGSFILLVGFLGCCGAITQRRSLLIAYNMFLFILFGSQATTGAFATFYISNYEDKIGKGISSEFKRSYETGKNADVWRFIEGTLECCGYKNGGDYKNTDKKKNDEDFPDFPESCCVGALPLGYRAKNPDKCKEGWNNDVTSETDDYHGIGCQQQIKDVTETYFEYISGGLIGIAIVEVENRKNDELTKAWRFVEATHECCGYDNGRDYDTINNNKKNDQHFPDFPRVVLRGVIGIAVVELLCMILVICVCRNRID